MFLLERKTVKKKSTSTEPTVDKRKRHDPSEFTYYICTVCGKRYTTQQRNFYKSYSPLYKGNNGYISVCKDCTQELYNHYLVTLGTEKRAIERICMKFDIYFSESAYKGAKRKDKYGNRLSNYISNIGLLHYKGLTYDNTIDEREKALDYENEQELREMTSNMSVSENQFVNAEVVDFFGTGFTPDEYRFLNKQYNDWITRHECETKSQEEIFKRLTYNQLETKKALQEGKKTENLDKTFQDLLGSANIKPVQKNSLSDSVQPFGVMLAEWEEEEPLPDIDEDLKDVDNIKEYIETWFIGGLKSSIGADDGTNMKYNEILSEYTVEPITYSDEEVKDGE